MAGLEDVKDAGVGETLRRDGALEEEKEDRRQRILGKATGRDKEEMYREGRKAR